MQTTLPTYTCPKCGHTAPRMLWDTGGFSAGHQWHGWTWIKECLRCGADWLQHNRTGEAVR